MRAGVRNRKCFYWSYEYIDLLRVTPIYVVVVGLLNYRAMPPKRGDRTSGPVTSVITLCMQHHAHN